MDARNDVVTETGAGYKPKPDMCPSDPRSLIDEIIEQVKDEAEMYKKLAKYVPTLCLRRVVAQMAADKAQQLKELYAIAAAYGLKPC